MSEMLGVSKPTLSARIADLTEKQGLLLKYRELQALQLTELQSRVLEAITPEKIQDASLSELVQAFRILKDKELVVSGKPSEITGLVGYLIQLEKQEHAQLVDITPQSTELDLERREVCREIVDSPYTVVQPPEDDLPKL